MFVPIINHVVQQNSEDTDDAERQRVTGWSWRLRQAVTNQVGLPHVRIPMLPNRTDQRIQLRIVPGRSQEGDETFWWSRPQHSVPFHRYSGFNYFFLQKNNLNSI